MAGEHVVIMQGRYGADMTRIISLNESALYLWNELQGKEFDTEKSPGCSPPATRSTPKPPCATLPPGSRN